ncbi:hypothetical protein [Calothrix sp. NIES-3974]|uniref:hypothetical protein n=1 Tax=Calothrix sp. NIES-3974 TaxID=2005462 RepID=UPI000B61A0FA|nr:hypothetical protein [Calothrix sp. NIES-3974]BAZ05348.1 hypothetical protein NIES3974_19950 [Calothrix sp. NIES-3974]
MQAEPNQTHPQTVPSTPTTSKFLILPTERRRFLSKFVLMTLLGWFVGGIATLVLLQTMNEQIIPTANQQMQWFWYYSWFYISTALFALIFAIDQAVVMRKYVSGWLWLFATFLGWLFSQSISHGWVSYIHSLALSLGRDLVTIERIVFASLSTIAANLAWTWLGFSQWVVLRKYTQGSWWWIFIHTLSFFGISFLVWLLSLGHDVIPEVYRSQVVFLAEQGCSAAILAIIPAIAACRLQGKVTKF